MTAQSELAARARAAVNAAPAASMERRAAGCALAVLATTRTANAAHQALDSADLDADVRAAAHRFLAQLDADAPTAEDEPTTPADSCSSGSGALSAPDSGEVPR